MKTGDEVDETDINWRAAKDRARLIVMSADEVSKLLNDLDDPLDAEFGLVGDETRSTEVAGYIVIKVEP